MLIHSEQIDQLASALAHAQADLGVVFKQSRNDAFGSKYADLTRVWDAFQRVGPRHGLSVVQMPGAYDPAARTMSMSVRLMHNSGQWLGGDMSMPLSRGDAHAYGSACTYARRYSLAALVGICPHDDDGNAASGLEPGSRFWSGRSKSVGWEPGKPGAEGCQHPESYAKKPTSEVSASRKALDAVPNIPHDPQGLLELRRLAAEADVSEADLCRHYNVTALEQLSPRDAARVRRALIQKVEPARGGAN